jgi:hypothetical protein
MLTLLYYVQQTNRAEIWPVTPTAVGQASPDSGLVPPTDGITCSPGHARKGLSMGVRRPKAKQSPSDFRITPPRPRPRARVRIANHG